MRQLYLSCEMGAAGDMLLGALAELTGAPETLPDQLSALGLPGVTIKREAVNACGIVGMRISVQIHGASEDGHEGEPHHHDHHHGHSMEEIDELIMSLPVSERVRTDAKNIYCMLAYAESQAHGRPVSEIHFHEVGMLDAIVDIVGCCLLMEKLKPDRVTVSTVSLGGGTVHCAHGELPVPAPATALLLRDVPVKGGPVQGELCTPTGAAILKYFADSFGPLPEMVVERIGCGYGARQFDRPNCVRAFLGGSTEETDANEWVSTLCCQVDDMTGEQAGATLTTMMAAGALDAFLTPIQMKKGRPGFLFTVLCPKDAEGTFAKLLLAETTTFGVRASVCHRYVLNRSESPVDTDYGPISIKRGQGYGVEKMKPAFDDMTAAAKAYGVPVQKVAAAAGEAFAKELQGNK
jgi:uncharacterized protein (TIGR00299 family) protein